MKLVLLPGMDGTGLLFEEVISKLGDTDIVTVPLPQSGPQNYEHLCKVIMKHLPQEDYIILAESFSGGIAAKLSQKGIAHLKGIVFIASFLSAPKPLMAHLARLLPIKALIALPMSSIVHRALFLGTDAATELVLKFKKVISSVPTETLKTRLSVIANYRYISFQSPCPAVYIGAANDLLVNKAKKNEFAKAYADITFIEIEGPHFLLQTRPAESATAIRQAMHLLEESEEESGKESGDTILNSSPPSASTSFQKGKL